MPRALLKSRLHSNKQKLENKPELIDTISKLPHTYKHLKKNYYPETALLNISKI